MAAFGDWAQNYYDLGFSVLPVDPKTKRCLIKEWTDKFSKRFPTEAEQEVYLTKYDDHDIGLATGESSGVVAIDFDYENMADAKAIEQLIIGVLPITPCIKKGAKGWTRFYKFDGEVKNAGINRFGTRMVDVLSTGRLTVLPPSRHTREGIWYQWIGATELLDLDSDSLPYITNKHIVQLHEIADTDNSIFNDCGVNQVSRHDAIVGFCLRYSDEASDLEDLVQKCMEFDLSAHKDDPKGPYLIDEKYLKGKTSYEFTKGLCERVCDWKARKRAESGITWDIGKYPRLHAQGKKSSTNFEDFKSFFEFNYPDVRFDKVRRTSYYFSKRLKKWEPIDNIREVIESQASEAGLSPSYVNRHLQRWTSSFEPRLTIDIPRWGGRDVVAEMVSRLNVTNISEAHVCELFKEWGANIFRRLYDVNKREQNAMIILKGGQGIGKDSWINYAFGAFGSYFSEIEIQEKKIENYQTISDLLIANIPEFDETHKVSLSTLKSLITSPGATFRAAYARKSDYVPFYVSYISSCNFDHILRDSSGNRRFMIFEVSGIKWDYSGVPQDQILGQFHHLYKINYKASNEAHKAMKDYVATQTPDSIDDLILDDCVAIIRSATPLDKRPVRWHEISNDISRISNKYKCSIRRVQSILTQHGLTARDRSSKLYRVPDTIQ